MYFHGTPGLLKLMYPSLVWEKKLEKENSLFLTFDDGPVEGATEFVLNTLKKYNAKATFFCVGQNIQKYPHILQKLIEDGHSIGNHTMHHLNGWKMDDKKYFKDVEDCDIILDAFLGQSRAKIFRPPYGRIKRSQIREIKKDHEIIMWDVLSGDFDQELSKNICLEKSISLSKNGSIIIFHDSLKSEKTLQYVLPKFLEHFSNLDYKFLSL